jgi:chaperonin GroES
MGFSHLPDEQKHGTKLKPYEAPGWTPQTNHPRVGLAPIEGTESRPKLSGVPTNRKERSAMKKFKPLQDRILVKRLEEKEVKKGGIIIPDTAKEKPQEGEVIAIGPGKVTDDGKLQPMSVKVGDKILFGKYSGSEVKLGDDEYLIMREEDVLGILQ